MMTAFVIVFVVTFTAIYDAAIYAMCGYDATITAVVKKWDSECPITGKLAMLAIGLLIGHLWL